MASGLRCDPKATGPSCPRCPASVGTCGLNVGVRVQPDERRPGCRAATTPDLPPSRLAPVREEIREGDWSTLVLYGPPWKTATTMNMPRGPT